MISPLPHQRGAQDSCVRFSIPDPVNPTTENPQATVANLFALYQDYGAAAYIGEPVSLLEHMAQAAALAEAESFEDEVVLAAFFHDLGHLCAYQVELPDMDGFGAVDHEQIGADYLRAAGFSERVATLVESHVLAKRYLTFKDPDYLRRLSPASLASLAFQGGVMTAGEAAAFEQNPDAAIIIRLREWDDLAKEEGRPVGDLDWLKSMAINHLSTPGA